MPTFDPVAKAALDQQVIAPAFFGFIDILGDPIRVTTYGANVIFSESADPELDGEFKAIDPKVIDIGPITNREGGSETVSLMLSGLLLPDAELLALMGDQSKWRGRVVRLWMMIYNEDGIQQGAIVPYSTGYMVGLDLIPSAQSQILRLRVENYLTLLAQPSNRSYLGQNQYDAGDTSAAATIGAANNASTGPGSVGLSTGTGGGGAGSFSEFSQQVHYL
jgi:hypothetical protein